MIRTLLLGLILSIPFAVQAGPFYPATDRVTGSPVDIIFKRVIDEEPTIIFKRVVECPVVAARCIDRAE